MEALKECICGCLSGISQVWVMQPFEIVKVRLVNQSLFTKEYNGIVDCISKIFHEQGLMAFYRGTLSPLIAVVPQVGLQFGFNKFFKISLIDTDQQPQFHLVSFAAFLTGFPSSIAVTPSDHIRIKMQTKRQKDYPYKNTIDAARKIYLQFGIRGIYMGYNITLVRELIAMTVYFTSYQYLMLAISQGGGSTSDAPLLGAFIAGGVAGSASWLFTYPIDYVKTLMQSQSLKKRKFTSSIQCAAKKYQQEGLKTFFKGLGITMLRSFPVNGVGFLTFQGCKRLMFRMQQSE